MATKLKTPITVTITHIENAVNICRADEFARGRTPSDNFVPGAIPNEIIRGQVIPALREQGIEWDTWQPTPPFRIAGHETTFNPDGSIKVGCTTVSSNEFKAAQDKRTEAMNASCDGCSAQESEFPKYWQTVGDCILEALSEGDFGIRHDRIGSQETTADTGVMVEFCKRFNHVPIPRVEAEGKIRKWEKARQPKPADWPKYWLDYEGDIAMAKSSDDLGMWFCKQSPTVKSVCRPPMFELAKETDWKQLTIPEAEHMIVERLTKSK